MLIAVFRKSPMPLAIRFRVAAKFNLILSLALLIAAIACAVLLALSCTQTVRDEHTADAEASLSSLVQVLAEVGREGNTEAFAAALRMLNHDSAFECLALRDVRPSPFPAANGCPPASTGDIRIERPVIVNGSEIGVLEGNINTRAPLPEAAERVARELWLLVVLIAVAWAASYLAMTRVVLKPLRAIGAALDIDSGAATSDLDEMARIAGAVDAMIRDAHQRTRMLSENARQLRLLLEQAPFPLFVCRLKDQRILHASRRGLELLGVEVTGALSLPFLECFVADDSSEPDRLFTGDTVTDLESRYKGPDGSLTWVLASSCRLDYLGESCVMIALQDINRRKAAQAALIAATEQAQSASRAKSEFLAHMSHEIRTPLNAILGFSDMMRLRTFGPLGHPKYDEYADDIQTSGRFLLSLVNDVLDLSKVEAGRLELHEEEFGFIEAVGGAVETVRAQAQAKGVAVVARIDPQLPPLWADPRLVRQILLNLLSNAVKFTHAGGSVTVLGRRGSHGGLKVVVADDGIGMKAEEIPLVLEPFRQAPSTHPQVSTGTGLGLPLAKKLIEAHGGTIAIVSEHKVGTTVILRFPASRFRSGAAAGA